MTIEFAQRLSAYMEREEHMSQRELAKKAGLSSQAICRLLKGNRAATSETAAKLANGLRVPLDQRAEFLLFAVGCSEEEVQKSLGKLPRVISEITYIKPVELKDSSGKKFGTLRY